jgi:hypothetical protein
MKQNIALSLILATLVLGGCVFAPSGSGGWDGDERRVRPTVGQELLDLDRAHDAGVIDDAEYERAKDRILER